MHRVKGESFQIPSDLKSRISASQNRLRKWWKKSEKRAMPLQTRKQGWWNAPSVGTIQSPYLKTPEVMFRPSASCVAAKRSLMFWVWDGYSSTSTGGRDQQINILIAVLWSRWLVSLPNAAWSDVSEMETPDLSVWDDKLTVMRLFFSLVLPLLSASGKDELWKSRKPRKNLTTISGLRRTESAWCGSRPPEKR